MIDRRTRALRGARYGVIVSVALGTFAAACSRAPETKSPVAAAAATVGMTYVVHDTTISSTFDAAGIAAPIQQATLSTKLMGTVTDVVVQEGDRVTAGQVLVRIDARDLSAKSAQVAASIAEA